MKRCLSRWLAAAVVVPLIAGVAALRAEELKKPEEPAKKEEAAAAKPGGRLQIDKPVVDVGEVVRGQEAKAVFELKNVGEKELKILSAKPG